MDVNLDFSFKLLVVSVFFGISTAAIGETTNCLQSGLEVEPIDFNQEIVDDREIKILITNNLDFPLGGVWVDFEIWAEERPLPLYSASIREAATIDGALLPGESMVASDFHFMDDRNLEFARNTNKLSITLTVRNAADIDMRGFFEHPAMGSWASMLTDETCSVNSR